MSFQEAFERADLDPRLKWLNPPSSWSVEAVESVLVVEPSGGSDFWQRTHYGFRADSGSFLHVSLGYDFRMSTRVHLYPRHQYDQAGLMVRVSADYLVYWREPEQRWRKLRLCHLHEGEGKVPVLAGLYACCPKKPGFVAKFEHLTIDPAV